MFRNRLIAGLVLLVSLISCDDIPDQPNPPRLVNDFARVFTQEQVDSLEYALVGFDKRTSNQICVVTVKTLSGMEVDDFGIQLANKWGIGTKNHQNGVLLLMKPRGRDNNYIDVTIQVGRGLEGAIPDVYASRIIRRIMGPHLKRDNYWTATTKACNELMGLASGEISEPRSSSGFKERISGIKQDIKSGFHNLLHELLVGFLGLLGFGLFFGIIFLIEKRNDKKRVDKDSDNKDDKNQTNPPIIDPGIIDTDIHSHSHQSDSTNNGGFGGFGGGGFGGGGASGRF